MPVYSSLLTTSKLEITYMGLYKSSSHVFCRCKYHQVWTPKLSTYTLMDVLKGCSAIRLYSRFPHIRKKL